MKIIHVYGAFIDHSYVKRIGGIEEHFINLNEKLAPDIFVVYAEEPNDINFKKIMNKKNDSIVILTSKSYLLYFIDYIKFILRQKREEQNLLIHVHFTPIAHIIIWISYLLGIKNIYWTKHSRMMVQKFSKPWFLSKISSSFVKKIICVSNAVERELYKLDIGKNKTEVIPLGLNIEKYKRSISLDDKTALRTELDIDVNDFVITIVAQQRPEKRVEVFIKAFAHFIKEYNIDNAVGLIVGGGPLETENIHLAKELEMTEKLKFLGLRHDIDVIYKISDLAGLTSETEGFGLALAEAGALSLPLFGSNAGAIPEVIKNKYSGYLFEVGDYQSLSNIFYKFYNDPLLKKKFGENSFKHISENYEINACSNKLIKLYNSEYGLRL